MIDPLDPTVTEALRAWRLQHEAGTSTVDALHTCAGNCSGVARDCFVEAARRAADGEGISRLMDALAPLLPESERALIEAGWNSGRVEETLKSVISQRELWLITRKRVHAKMLMPALVLIMAAFVAPLPALVLGGSMIVYLLSALIPLVLAFYLWHAGGRLVMARAHSTVLVDGKPKGPDKIDTLLLAVPVAAEVERQRSLAEFSSLLSNLLASGIPIDRALEMCARVARNGLYRQSIMGFSGVARSGNTLHSALQSADERLWPPEFVSAVVTGEKSGSLDTVLARVGENARERYASAIDKLGEWTPRILYAGVCLYVIFNIFRMALSIYGKGGMYDQAFEGTP